jgi:HEPN domain-containing protein
MPPDPALEAEVQAWLAKATTDLRAAALDAAAVPPLLDDAVFHCQQAVEKALKAFLTWHQRTFRKTHDLVELGALCVSIDSDLEPALRAAAPLTEYAWAYRYPVEPSQPSEQETREAQDVARSVFDAIVMRLPDAVRPR